MNILFLIAIICLVLSVICESSSRCDYKPLPGPDRVKILDKQKYSYTFGLEPPVAKNIVMRHVHVIINGIEETKAVLPDTKSYSLTFEDEAEVEIFIQDQDIAGTMSEPSESLAFVVKNG